MSFSSILVPIGASWCNPGPGNGSNCSFATFQPSNSTTWKELGDYSIDSGLKLSKFNISGSGSYGVDLVTLGPSANDIQLQSQLVGGAVMEEFFMGLFGMSDKPALFGGINFATLLSNLGGIAAIPSTSWSYTAGSVNGMSPSLYIYGLRLGVNEAQKIAQQP